MGKYLLALVIVVLCHASAWAQQNVINTPNPALRNVAPSAATITSTHATLIAAGTYGFVEVENQSGTATVRCVWGGTSVAADTAGQYTIAPYGGYIWDANNPPPAGKILDCISSAASSPFTYRFQ